MIKGKLLLALIGLILAGGGLTTYYVIEGRATAREKAADDARKAREEVDHHAQAQQIQKGIAESQEMYRVKRPTSYPRLDPPSEATAKKQ